MLPAQQCLKPRNLPGFEFQDGLVVHAKLPLLERLAQLGFQLQPVHGAGVHCLIKHFAARSSHRFGAAHGDVGIHQEILGALVRGLAQSDAHACRGAHLAPLHQK